MTSPNSSKVKADILCSKSFISFSLFVRPLAFRGSSVNIVGERTWAFNYRPPRFELEIVRKYQLTSFKHSITMCDVCSFFHVVFAGQRLIGFWNLFQSHDWLFWINSTAIIPSTVGLSMYLPKSCRAHSILWSMMNWANEGASYWPEMNIGRSVISINITKYVNA